VIPATITAESEEKAAERRAEEVRDTLRCRPRNVCGGQLLRRSRKRGHERRARRPRGRAGDRGQGGKTDDDAGPGLCRCRRRGGNEDGRARQVGHHHDLPARESVTEQGAERGRDRHHQHPDGGDEPDGRGAARLVRDDREHDRVRRDRDGGGDTSQLDPAQARVGEDALEGATRIGEHRPHHAHVRSISMSIAFRRRSEEDVVDSPRLRNESSSEEKGAGMPESEQLPEEEDVEAHGFVKPPAGGSINPPDPSATEEKDDVEGPSFAKPPGGAGLNPPDPT
jgi:hypothetical protein